MRRQLALPSSACPKMVSAAFATLRSMRESKVTSLCCANASESRRSFHKTCSAACNLSRTSWSNARLGHTQFTAPQTQLGIGSESAKVLELEAPRTRGQQLSRGPGHVPYCRRSTRACQGDAYPAPTTPGRALRASASARRWNSQTALAYRTQTPSVSCSPVLRPFVVLSGLAGLIRGRQSTTALVRGSVVTPDLRYELVRSMPTHA